MAVYTAGTEWGLTALGRELLTHVHSTLDVALFWQRLQIVGLHDQPGGCIATEGLRQPCSGICTYGAALLHDFVNADGGNTQSDGQCIHTWSERRKKVLAQNLTRVNGTHTVDWTCHVSSFNQW